MATDGEPVPTQEPAPSPAPPPTVSVNPAPPTVSAPAPSEQVTQVKSTVTVKKAEAKKEPSKTTTTTTKTTSKKAEPKPSKTSSSTKSSSSKTTSSKSSSKTSSSRTGDSSYTSRSYKKDYLSDPFDDRSVRARSPVVETILSHPLLFSQRFQPTKFSGKMSARSRKVIRDSQDMTASSPGLRALLEVWFIPFSIFMCSCCFPSLFIYLFFCFFSHMDHGFKVLKSMDLSSLFVIRSLSDLIRIFHGCTPKWIVP